MAVDPVTLPSDVLSVEQSLPQPPKWRTTVSRRLNEHAFYLWRALARDNRLNPAEGLAKFTAQADHMVARGYVARGYADDQVRVLARELGVEP